MHAETDFGTPHVDPLQEDGLDRGKSQASILAASARMKARHDECVRRGHGWIPEPNFFTPHVNQTCIVHLVRQSLRYLSWKERKSCASELRRIYTAADADAARKVLDELSNAWANSKTRTAALAVWERAWDRVIPFLAFPDEIRRIIYTTNSVESLHMQVRKTIKTRGHFPNDDAALRLIWLAIMRAKTTWRTCYNWTQAMAVLRIHFGDRIPDNT